VRYPIRVQFGDMTGSSNLSLGVSSQTTGPGEAPDYPFYSAYRIDLTPYVTYNINGVNGF
jgi:hypothetical protein